MHPSVLLPLTSILVCALLVGLCRLLWGTVVVDLVVDLKKTFGKTFSFLLVGVVCCTAIWVLKNRYLVFGSLCDFVYVPKDVIHFVDAS